MNRVIAPSVVALTTVALLSGCSLLGGSSVQQFTVGQCVNDPVLAEDGQIEVGTMPIVDCAEPHTGEVFYVEDLPDGDYPSDASTLGETLCPDNFDAYVGTPYLESSLYVTQLYPTPETWADGDRQIVCLIVEENGGELTGSAKDSGL